MKKIDVFEEGMMIPKIEFDVYYKLNGINLIKLNLSYCSNSKIDISIPTNMSEKDLDKYNSSSDYYNDICYTTTSESGTDITLKDRKTDFIDNNKTLCQENCLLSGYNNNINKAKCSCDIVEPSSEFENMKIDKTKLYKNFIDIKNIANINLLVCYKVLFSKKGLINNYGSYSILVIIISHFIIIIIYYTKNLYSQIQNIINNISLILDNFEFLFKQTGEYKNKERLKNSKNKMKIKEKRNIKFGNKKNKKSKGPKKN